MYWSSRTGVGRWGQSNLNLNIGPLCLKWNLLFFIESIRTGNFLSYRESLSMFIPWVFSFDHINYARWLSVHIRYMFSLSETHPVIYKEFVAGRFVAHKTNRPFSAMTLDQAHEQANANVKGDGRGRRLDRQPKCTTTLDGCRPRNVKNGGRVWRWLHSSLK